MKSIYHSTQWRFTVSQTKVKFATQVAPDVLQALRAMSDKEGRHLQAIIDEALRTYIEKKQGVKPRRHVLAALQASMTEHDNLYEALSK